MSFRFRDGAQRFNQVVDVGIKRRKMAAAARRNPSAKRGIFEALRIVAQREAMRAKLRFERGSIGPALDQCRARVESFKSLVGAEAKRLSWSLTRRDEAATGSDACA